VHEEGSVKRFGRVEVAELELFAGSLLPDDHVVIESTSQTWAVVELLSRHVERVTLSNPMRTRAIALISVEATDLFGRKGRRALQSVDLPAHERENVDCALRLHDALDGEIRLVEKALADRALKDSGARLLMSIPGVGPMTSLSIVSVIGDIGRFESSRQLVSYFGLDPRVRQSGERAARHGHISREGQAHARGLLVEAAHSAVRSPGPLRAFYQRIRSRRGTKIAICATTRKLLTIAWQLLTKQEPYRYEAPSATRRKSGCCSGTRVALSWSVWRESARRESSSAVCWRCADALRGSRRAARLALTGRQRPT
jgi:transposase